MGTTLPETNSSHPKIGHPKRKGSEPSNHPFSGAKMLLVSGRVNINFHKIVTLEDLTQDRNPTNRHPKHRPAAQGCECIAIVDEGKILAECRDSSVDISVY